MVTRQEVADAYRYILGREPESAAAVDSHLEVKSVAELRKLFLESPEFGSLYARHGIHGQPPTPMPVSDQPNSGPTDSGTSNPEHDAQAYVEKFIPAMDLPFIQVDTEASPAELKTLLNRIKCEWEEFGRDEPHWSVLTHDSYKKDSLEKNRQEFFSSGKHVANIIQSFAERNGLTLGAFKRCFELGCGVGRLTLQLAGMFPRVIGADISHFHLDICKEELRRAGFSNVELLCLTDAANLQEIPEFDFFVSLIVLQHNPPPVMKVLLETILAKLKPGGVGIFQIPTYRKGYRFDLGEYLHHPGLPHMEMHVLPQPVVFEVIGRSGCRVIEVREDSFASGRTSESLSNTFFVRK